MVKTMKFQDIQVNAPGYGAMGLSQAYGPADDNVSRQTLAKAVEIGCTFWDSAVLYGAGHNEKLLGDWIRQNNARDKVFIASKCGFECIGSSSGAAFNLGGISNKPAHINEYIEGTRERLGFYPDLYYLHRIDLDTPLEESIPALDALKKAGKCKYIGLSECSAETLRKANAIAHIDALQIEYSPFYTDPEENGLLDTARELGITVIAFSPLGKGILSGKYRSQADFAEQDFRRTIPRFNEENLPLNLRIADEFERLAKKKGCTPAQLALAWVMAQGVIPIPGTKTEDRLVENFGAGNVELTDAELKELRTAIDAAKPKGDRYSAVHMAQVGR